MFRNNNNLISCPRANALRHIQRAFYNLFMEEIRQIKGGYNVADLLNFLRQCIEIEIKYDNRTSITKKKMGLMRVSGFETYRFVIWQIKESFKLLAESKKGNGEFVVCPIFGGFIPDNYKEIALETIISLQETK